MNKNKVKKYLFVSIAIVILILIGLLIYPYIFNTSWYKPSHKHHDVLVVLTYNELPSNSSTVIFDLLCEIGKENSTQKTGSFVAAQNTDSVLLPNLKFKRIMKVSFEHNKEKDIASIKESLLVQISIIEKKWGMNNSVQVEFMPLLLPNN